MEDDQVGPEVDEETEEVVQLESVQDSSNSGMALASLIIAVVSLIVSFIPLVNVIAVVLAVIALILGIIALFKKQGGKAIAGIVLSLLALLICVGMYVLLGMGAQMISEALETNYQTEGLDVAEGYYLDNSRYPVVVNGKITNNTDQEIMLPIVSFRAFDENDEQFASSCSDARAENLKPGETWDFAAKCESAGGERLPARVELIGVTHMTSPVTESIMKKIGVPATENESSDSVQTSDK